MNIEQLNEKLVDFLTTEVPGKFQNGQFPFFDEDDLVSTVHAFLKSKTVNSEIRIFKEFPVHMVAPVRLTQKAYQELSQNFRNLDNYYRKISSGYYEINTDFNKLIIEDPFRGDKIKEGKYNRVYEPKYFDLVVLSDYKLNVPDELNVPDMVMEFKYEAGKVRRGKDLRKDISLPKNNRESIQHDMNALDLFCRANKNKTGYFVFVDENEGKNIDNFVPTWQSGEFMRSNLPGECKGLLLIKKFKY